MKKKLTLLIAGPLAPPAGGVSMHLQRLEHLLQPDFHLDFIDEARQVKKQYFNIRSANFIVYIRKLIHADVFFIHTGNGYLKKVHILAARLLGKKIIVTIHGFGKKRSPLALKIDSFFYRLANKIILVNPEIFNQLSIPNEKCVIKHAFLPPVMEMEPPLPEDVLSFIQDAKIHDRIILCANASRLNMHNGEDLYGIDMCIELVKSLKEAGREACMIFILSSDANSKNTLDKYRQMIKDYDLSSHFMLRQNGISFVRLIQNSDIIIRPTNTDGDALTVREGLFLGKKVIASDVTQRPEGSILFKTRNQEDLLNITLREMDNLRNHERNIQKAGSSEEFKLFYQSLINEIASA